MQTVLSFTKSVENTRKHISVVTFNIGFFPWLFPLFCKISVKGRVTELKVKMAKKLRKFLSIEISTFKYKLQTNLICLLGRFLDNLPSFQHQIVKERGLLGRARLLHLSGFTDEYGQNKEKRGQIVRICYEFRNLNTPKTWRGSYWPWLNPILLFKHSRFCSRFANYE